MTTMSGTTANGTPYLLPTDPPDLPGVSKALAGIVDQAAVSAAAAAASASAAAGAAAVPLRRVYTANATWTKPTTSSFLGAWVYVCGGGAGAPPAGTGWAPGGGAGVRMWLAASELPATVAVIVGGPSLPGTGSTPRPGNPSSFGSLIYAGGGSVANLTTAMGGPGVASQYVDVSGPSNAGTPFAQFAGGMGGSTQHGGASLYGGGGGGGGAGGLGGRGGVQHVAGAAFNTVPNSAGTSASQSGVAGVSRSGTERGGDGGGAAYSLAAGGAGDGGNGGIPGGAGGCAATGRTPGTGARGEVIVTEVYGVNGTGS